MPEPSDRLCAICRHSGYDHLNETGLMGCNVSECTCTQFNLPSRGVWAGVSLAALEYLLELSTASSDKEEEEIP